MSEELIEYNNMLTLRSQLITVPIEELCILYQDKNDYISFLNSVVLLFNVDSAFLLFSDEFFRKILSIVEIHRFDFVDAKVDETINSIILYINGVHSYPLGLVNQLKNGYLAFQEDQRETQFYSDEALLKSLAYDACVFTTLRDGNLNSVQDDNLFLLSFNYLLKNYPELFLDKNVRNNVTALFDKVGKNTGIFDLKKIRIKRTLEKYHKVVNDKE